MESKEQSLSKIVTALSGVNWGKDVEENHLKRIANSLESVTKEQEKSIVEILSGGSGGGGCTPITYSELKSLRDNSQLSPGTSYRITDYNCVTAQEGTSSENRQFDIIVTALSENVLSEQAKATNHKFEGEPILAGLSVMGELCTIIAVGTATFSDSQVRDVTRFAGPTGFEAWTIAQDYSLCYPVETSIFVVSGDNITVNETLENFMGNHPMNAEPVYSNKDFFDKCNIAAWELNYCLDNDTSRFAWAKAPIPATPADPGTYPATQVTWRHDPGSSIYRRTPDDDAELEGTLYYGWRYVNNSNRKTGLDDPTIQWESLSDTVYYTLTDYVRVGTSPFYFVVDGKIEPYDEPIIRLSSIPCPAEPGGKGVIYRMKDEWGNECPYDFKNIKFGHFTFDYLGDDATSLGEELASFNVVKEYYGDKNTLGIRHIPVNYFRINRKLKAPELCFTRNFLGVNCSNNSFSLGASYNRLENSCESNSFSNAASSNRLESKCSSNALSGSNNVLGFGCSGNSISGNYNVLGSGCLDCTFTNASKNVLGVECNRVQLPANADFNKIGNTCIDITLSTFCRWNTIESECQDIYMGEWCCNNVIGIGCIAIRFGTYCSHNTFETDCQEICFGTGNQVSQLKSYYYNIYVETGNYNLRLICTQNLGRNSKYQHVRIRQRTNYAISGSVTTKEIRDANVNQDHLTVYKTSTIVETNV